MARGAGVAFAATVLALVDFAVFALVGILIPFCKSFFEISISVLEVFVNYLILFGGKCLRNNISCYNGVIKREVHMAEDAKTGVASDAGAKKGRASKKKEDMKEVDSVAEKVAEVKEVTTGSEVTESSETKDVSGIAEAEVVSETEGDGSSEEDVVCKDGTEDTADGKTTETAEKKVRKPRKNKATARKTESVKADDVMNEESSPEEFQAEIREQIENCKNELKTSLERSIKQEFTAIANKKLRAANRRRRVGVIVRDIIILLLAGVVGYFGWCLYDARYFDWMESRPETNEPEPSDNQEIDGPEVVVKDTRWYINNYGYLFEDLQIGLNADNVEAYYLYSDDRKVSEIKPAYLLGMAYNKVMPETSSAEATTETSSSVAAADLRTAFDGMFGTTDYFEKVGFTHGCKKFAYARETDSFVTENNNCTLSSEREVVEEIDEMYEEGSVLYVLTTAAIYDEDEASFYSFDNLFKPAVTNAKKEDLTKNRVVLNRYQYQFKKTGEKYHFSGVVKLQ